MAIQSSAALQTLLNRIHRKSYPAYKETKGIYQFDRYVLSIDHVQGDPFASPSKVSIRVLGKDARFPSILYDSYEKRIALQDYLTRKFHQGIDRDVYKRQISTIAWLANSFPSKEFKYLAGMITSVSTLSPYLNTCPNAFIICHLLSLDWQ